LGNPVQRFAVKHFSPDLSPALILLLVEFIETCPENVSGTGITSKDTCPPRLRQEHSNNARRWALTNQQIKKEHGHKR